MKGQITNINLQKGMVAVLTDTEGYSIFEILSDDNFEIGDEVVWNENHPLGDCEIDNVTQDEKQEVYFQNHHVSSESLKKLLY